MTSKYDTIEADDLKLLNYTFYNLPAMPAST